MAPAGSPTVRISRRILDRYILDDETPVVATRRHWVTLVEPVATALVTLLVAGAVSAEMQSQNGEVSSFVWWIWFAVLARAVWRLLEWSNEWFVATDRRMLMVYGLVTHKVAMMPLGKVTDMNFGRSLLGRLLGYGQFVMESAGQDQAMREISFVPDPDEKYRRICATIFGPQHRGAGVAGAPGRGPGGPGGGGRFDPFDEEVEEDPFETHFHDEGPSIADRFDPDIVRLEPRPRAPRWESVDRDELPPDWEWEDEGPRRPDRPRLRVVTPDPDPTGDLPPRRRR